MWSPQPAARGRQRRYPHRLAETNPALRPQSTRPGLKEHNRHRDSENAAPIALHGWVGPALLSLDHMPWAGFEAPEQSSPRAALSPLPALRMSRSAAFQAQALHADSNRTDRYHIRRLP